MLIPQWPNDRWSLDFVADQFIDGRRMRILVVVDDCTHECLALVADTSISGIQVPRHPQLRGRWRRLYRALSKGREVRLHLRCHEPSDGDRVFAFRSAVRPSGFPYLTGCEQKPVEIDQRRSVK